MPESQGLQSLSGAQVAAVLGLLPHREGGYYGETYRSPVVVPTPAGPRALSTAIVYLLTADDPSRFHRLRFDEVWFFHAGAPVEMVFLDPFETVVVGREAPQALAPGGRWMGARVLEPGVRSAAGSGAQAEPGGGAEALTARNLLPPPQCNPAFAPESATGPDPAWALVGCMVSPGFEYQDFEAGERDLLLAAYPEAADYIRALTGG